MSFLEHKIPPPILTVLIALLMWWGASRMAIDTPPPSWRYAVVILLVMVGVTLGVLGVLAFRAAQTTTNPLKPEQASALVTTGVYQLTRNPMYLGLLLWLLALAAYLWSWLLLAGPFIFVLYMTRLQIQPEERILQNCFGERYSVYVAKVRRWI